MPTIIKNTLKKFISTPPKGIVVPKISENSLAIMEKRHLLKDKSGKILEDPKQMFWRVASSLSMEDKKYVKGSEPRKMRVVERTALEFYTTLAENRFLPGSRVLFEAGNDIDGTGQLSSCFVLPLEDDLESIFQTMKEAAIVQKNNGGTGFNFSHIRPKGDTVGGTANVAAGPVHFVRTFSQAFDQVLQGKKRGGGNMAILNINHPDIIEFINLKGKDSSIRNFNISVGVTDEFMNAVKNDTEYDLINPRTNKVVKSLRAREVFDMICEKAWECADPGLFFLDTTQNANPTKPLGIIEATNPCGEEPLRAYESCNLGSIVLPSHLVKTKKGYDIDWETLRKSIHTATHFLDNMIDLSRFPLQKIQEQVDSTRKLGLGVVGLASMLYKMHIPYNSQAAIDLMEKIMKFVEDESIHESIRLAEERGVFPGFAGSKWDEMGLRVRNATMTSIAPTGTLSLVADTSSGIEPVFSLVFARHSFYQDEGQEERKKLLYINKEFEEYAREHKFYTHELMEQIANNHGTLKGIDSIPDEAQAIFVTTHDIDPDWHVKMQAAAQKFTDAAVSKTINLSHEATIGDVRKAYIQAWEKGCKGITIYRDGSKEYQVLQNVNKEPAAKPKLISFTQETSHTLTPNALQVLEKRALLKDSEGNLIETPDQLWRRIAEYIASPEDAKIKSQIEQEFYEVMSKGEFYCGGTLIWAGMGKDTILSKCLVLPIADSIDSIFETLNWNIQCLRRGVGTGFNLSKIRSTYARVGTTGELAAGPIEYLRMFNRAQDTIRGRGGRGMGSMAILNADHPNIEEFIECKDDLTSITHYNISIGASDKFMQAVKADSDWTLVDPKDSKVQKTVKARELFEKIAKHAWISGDPGMYFLDRAEEGNTTPNLGRMDATNPCGEQPLIPFETCNMGHVNLKNIVMGFPFADDANFKSVPLEQKLQYVNWDRLGAVVKTAVRFLDNIIDINNYPIPQIEEMTKKTRNIGVGVMGLADLFVKLGIAYGSQESLDCADQVMAFIQEQAHLASQELGKEKGNFPAFNESILKNQGLNYRRNVRVTTIAPTGTISIVGNCNPGIEPLFALGYRRKNSMGGVDQEVIEPLFSEIAEKRGFASTELMHQIADGKHLSEIDKEFNIPADVVEVYKTTHEVEPEQHVYLQSVFQKHVDSAVSKTINLPNSASWQEIARVYQLAFETGCKGITVFRDGSKDPALQVGTKNKELPKPQAVVEQTESVRYSLEPRKRSEVVKGYTYEVNTEQGSLYITINEDEKGIFEVFLNLGKSGSYTAGYTQAVGRLVSMSLRSGIKPEAIIKQLQGIRTSAPTMNKGMIVYSVPDAVAKIMKKHLDEKQNQMHLLKDEDMEVQPIINIEQITVEKAQVAPESTPSVSVQVETVETTPEEDLLSKYSKNNQMGDMLDCPECGGDLEYAEGCILCRACGFSKCG